MSLELIIRPEAETEMTDAFDWYEYPFLSNSMPKEKGTQMLEFTATPGDHVLTVTAPGCETWQKTINIMDNARFGQSFWSN